MEFSCQWDFYLILKLAHVALQTLMWHKFKFILKKKEKLCQCY